MSGFSSRAVSWSEATSPPLPGLAHSRPTDTVSSGRSSCHTPPGLALTSSTFSAFSEMIISELTMARLNFANVLTHFSHSGVDEMADNTWYVNGCSHSLTEATLVSTSSSSTTVSRMATRPSCTSQLTA